MRRIVASLVGPVVFFSAGAAIAQERFPDPPPPHGLYSDAVRVGDLVFLSGVVGGDPDPTAQFQSVFQRIGRILEANGSGLDRIVDLTTYHVDMHAHIDEFMSGKKPTATALSKASYGSPVVVPNGGCCREPMTSRAGQGASRRVRHLRDHVLCWRSLSVC